MVLRKPRPPHPPPRKPGGNTRGREGRGGEEGTILKPLPRPRPRGAEAPPGSTGAEELPGPPVPARPAGALPAPPGGNGGAAGPQHGSAGWQIPVLPLGSAFPLPREQESLLELRSRGPGSIFSFVCFSPPAAALPPFAPHRRPRGRAAVAKQSAAARLLPPASPGHEKEQSVGPKRGRARGMPGLFPLPEVRDRGSGSVSPGGPCPWFPRVQEVRIPRGDAGRRQLRAPPRGAACTAEVRAGARGPVGYRETPSPAPHRRAASPGRPLNI